MKARIVLAALALLGMQYTANSSLLIGNVVTGLVGSPPQGGYAAERVRVAFFRCPWDSVALELNHYLSKDERLSLGGEFANHWWAVQRSSEALYPRRIQEKSGFTLISKMAESASSPAGDRSVPLLEYGEFRYSLSGPSLQRSVSGDGIPLSLEFDTWSFLAGTLLAFGLGRLFFKAARFAANPLQVIPQVFLAGALGAGLVFSLGTWLQIPVPRMLLTFLGALGCLLPGWRMPSIKRAVLIKWLPEVMVFSLLAASFLRYRYLIPIDGWDGRSIWLFKAKELFFNHFLPAADFHNPSYDFSHPEYPLLFPAWAAIFTLFSQVFNERTLAVGVALLQLSVLAILWRLLSKRCGRLVGAAVFLTLYAGSYDLMKWCYQDGLLMQLLLIGILAFSERDLGFLALAAASLLKQEGLLFSAIILGIRFLVVGREWKLAIALVPGVLHTIWRRFAGVRFEFAGIRWAEDFGHFGRRLLTIVEVSGETVRHRPLLLISMLTGLSGIALAPHWSKRNLPALRVWLSGIALLGAVTAIYLITPQDLRGHLGSSVDRTLLSPAALIFAAIFIRSEV